MSTDGKDIVVLSEELKKRDAIIQDLTSRHFALFLSSIKIRLNAAENTLKNRDVLFWIRRIHIEYQIFP